MAYRDRSPYGRQMRGGTSPAEAKKLFMAWQSGKKLTDEQKQILVKNGLALRSDFK